MVEQITFFSQLKGSVIVIIQTVYMSWVVRAQTNQDLGSYKTRKYQKNLKTS